MSASDSDSPASGDESWEDHSVDSDGFSENDDSDSSSDEEGDVEGDSEGDVEVVRGAEPYRFEPLAPVPRETEDGGEAAVFVHDEDPAPVPPANNVRLNNTDWCSCGRCVLMELVHNCVCCKEVEAMEKKILHSEVDRNTFMCFTDHPWYEGTCLNPGTLETAYYQYKQQYGARAVEGDMARKYRHTSYRQVIRWCWGYLGRHNRVPLPSCVMHKTRTTFPDPEDNYQGFKYPDLDDMF